ncbi:3-oxoacyl-ACP synthase III family protein [Dactylosporangium sp. CA-233914]|uniref:3-oxoacyl-ACP synthase III family protein n=1 Tax=Dactylosporangium sp. CA-233914 TaxID=3239934 RepID=UPI003D902B1A
MRDHGIPAIGIVGTGGYLPAEVVSNEAVAERCGTTPEWIVRKTGIRQRRRAAPHEATSDLAIRAARSALDSCGLAPDDLGYVVVATSTPDHSQPATAGLVQHRIGATRAGAFDTNAACSGFVVALVSVARLLALEPPGAPRYGMVIGADTYSRVVDPSDRRTAALFGDGAGAVVLGPVRPGRGLVGARMSSRGELGDLIRVEAGGSRLPASPSTVADGRHFFRMQGRAVRDFVLDELPAFVRDVLGAHGVAPRDVEHFIPHQANGVMLQEVLMKLNLPRARTHLTVGEHGNTGSASVPLALDDARRGGTFTDGDLLLLTGFGGGMTFGAALVRWEGGTC